MGLCHLGVLPFTHLALAGCPHVTVQGLHLLLLGCRTLRSVHVAGCAGISYAALASIGAVLRRVTTARHVQLEWRSVPVLPGGGRL